MCIKKILQQPSWCKRIKTSSLYLLKHMALIFLVRYAYNITQVTNTSGYVEADVQRQRDLYMATAST